MTNDIFDPASKHYITIFVLCRAVDVNQEPKVCCISVTGHLFSTLLTLFVAGAGAGEVRVLVVEDVG